MDSRTYSARAKRSHSVRCGSSRSRRMENGSRLSKAMNLFRLNSTLKKLPASLHRRKSLMVITPSVSQRSMSLIWHSTSSHTTGSWFKHSMRCNCSS